MTELNNMQIISNAYECFGRGDIPALLKFFDEDIDWFSPGPIEIIPYAGQRVGHTEVAGFFKALFDSEETERFEPREFIVQDNKVVAFGNYRCRVRATGRTLDYDWVHVHTLRDGKLISFCEYYDTAAAVEAHQPN